jgi:hypothetical protein
MQTIFTEADLRAAIVQLEFKQAEEKIVLKEQALVAYESIKPINLIRNTLMEAAESQDLHDNFINSSVGLGAGYLSKLLFQGVTNSPIKKFLGTALMFGIKNVVAHNPGTVKSLGKVIFDGIRGVLHKRKIPDAYNETA